MHSIKFTNHGEIRFGPQLWGVTIDDFPIKMKSFDIEHRFSPDSKFLALQEYSELPELLTYLFIVDLEGTKFARVSKATGGFLSPLNFTQNKIVYSKRYPSDGRTFEYEMDLGSIAVWEQIA